MWEKGVAGETPTEYKRRHAGSDVEPASSTKSTKTKKTASERTTSQGWFSRLWKKQK
ncbi:putative endonuclease lcl3 [Stygiomarasmius scandens]|uniref:Endonuclease lcl3 n=1 Tax=Marasmiellus scandens TaxID=2682957 RepID=A0ABR1IRA0_9AGAR